MRRACATPSSLNCREVAFSETTLLLPGGMAAGSRNGVAGPHGGFYSPPAGTDLGHVRHRPRRPSQPLLERGSPAVPRLRGGLPLLWGGLLVPDRVEPRSLGRHRLILLRIASSSN